jgi:hypothetical protein
MTVEAIIHAVQQGGGSGGLGELKLELHASTASHVGSGEMSGREAVATFRIRQGTTERAGVDTAGFSDAVSALEKEAEDTRVELFHFKAPGKVFTVFAVGERVLGCIRVSRQDG